MLPQRISRSIQFSIMSIIDINDQNVFLELCQRNQLESQLVTITHMLNLPSKLNSDSHLSLHFWWFYTWEYDISHLKSTNKNKGILTKHVLYEAQALNPA